MVRLNPALSELCGGWQRIHGAKSNHSLFAAVSD